MRTTIILPIKRYHELLIAQEKLSRLEAGGVDNWEWYGESLNPEGVPSMEEYEESLKCKQ